MTNDVFIYYFYYGVAKADHIAYISILFINITYSRRQRVLNTKRPTSVFFLGPTNAGWSWFWCRFNFMPNYGLYFKSSPNGKSYFLSVPGVSELKKYWGLTTQGRKRLTKEIESTIANSLMLSYLHYFLCRIAWQMANWASFTVSILSGF